MRWVVNATTRPLYPRKTPDTHCIVAWVDTRAALDGYGKFRRYRDLICGPFILLRIAGPNELSRPLYTM